jgi:L-alanine-DL-glutamate epimerase-like enolase superfamily enzyme
VCECGRPDCERLLAITVGEYEAVRSDARRFVVVKDHVMDDVELVVDENARFTVVEKREGGAAEVAEALDPRA